MPWTKRPDAYSELIDEAEAMEGASELIAELDDVPAKGP